MKKVTGKDLNFRLSVLNSAVKIGITKTAELFNITRDSIYRWKKRYGESGVNGLLNKSRKEQFHPCRIADSERSAIHHLAAMEPELTLLEIIQRLNLKCTVNTVSRILHERLNTRNRKIQNSQHNFFNSFYINVEKIPVAGGTLPAYLFQIKELTTGLSFYAFSQDNSPNSTGIFADYFLSNLPIVLEPLNLTFYTCKGRFYHARGEKESLPEIVICKKFGAQLIASSEKLKIENELTNLIISNKSEAMSQFYPLFFNLVTQTNLWHIRQPAEWQCRLLLLPPLLIDQHCGRIDDICRQNNYWQKQTPKKSLPPLLLNLFEHLLHELERRVEKERDIAALEAFGVLFTLLEVSSYQNQLLEAKLLLKFSVALELCNQWKKAEQTVLKILNSVKFKTPLIEESEIKALEFVGEINQKNGNFPKAVEYYKKALLKFNNNDSAVAEKKAFLLKKIGICYKLCGEFSKAILSFRRIATLAPTDSLAENRYQSRKGIAGVYHTKGNYTHANKLYKQLLADTAKLEKSAAKYADIAWELGITYFFLQDYPSAEYYFSGQLDYLKSKVLPEDYYRGQGILGIVKYRLHKESEGQIYLQEYTGYLLKLAAVSPNKLEKVITWAEIASLKKIARDYAGAIFYLKKSISLAISIESLNEVAYGYLNLGDIYTEEGNYRKALKYTKMVLNLSARQKEFRIEFAAICNIAFIYRLMQDYTNAVIWYKKTAQIALQTHNTLALQNCYKQLALLDYQRADFKRCIPNFLNFLELCKSSDKSADKAQIYHYLANALHKVNNYDHSFAEIENYYILAEKNYLKAQLIEKLNDFYKDQLHFYQAYHDFTKARKIRAKALRAARVLHQPADGEQSSKLKI